MLTIAIVVFEAEFATVVVTIIVVVRITVLVAVVVSVTTGLVTSPAFGAAGSILCSTTGVY